MTTIASTPSPLPALSAALGSRFRLGLTDGRTLVGQFTCIDRQGNLVLDHALEYVPAQAEGEEGREVGLVLVPQRHWATVEREVLAGEGGEAEGGAGKGCVPS